MHTESRIRACHYYNNNKHCPFEDLGCMFAHKLSEIFKYGKHCKIRLCSFQHVNNSKSETSLKCCEYCDYKCESDKSVIEHMSSFHVDLKNLNDEFIELTENGKRKCSVINNVIGPLIAIYVQLMALRNILAVM